MTIELKEGNLNKDDTMKAERLVLPKFKDNPPHRGRYILNLHEQFENMPDFIFTDKVRGCHGRYIVSGVSSTEMKKHYKLKEKPDGKNTKRTKTAKKAGK